MIAQRRRVSVVPVALLAALLALPGAAGATRTPETSLSPRLAELAQPGLRSAPQRVQARRLGLAQDGPGSLLRRGNRVLAYVRFDRGAVAAAPDLRAVGAQTVSVSGRYQTVTVAAKPAQLPRISRVPGVEGVIPALAPVTAEATCPSGPVVSEGDVQLKARAAREATPGLDGSGVTVGILSDSFNKANEAADGSGEIATKAGDDVADGDLPGENECENKTPVDVLSEIGHASEATDEGRAMTQIVHDLAPGAALKFASAFNGEPAFAESIGDLAAAGANVIADDVFYLEEPFFQDGPVAVAVNEAEAAGVAYFSAAGNDNLRDAAGNNIASWETPEFRDSESCPPAVEGKPGFNATHCLDFNPGAQTDKTFGIEVEPESTLTVDLQWDEPWYGVNTDLDAFLLDATGGVIAESHEDNVAESGMPVEVVDWANESSSPRTVQLVVNRFAGGLPAVKFGLIEDGIGVEATEYPHSSGEDVVGPTIFGHSGAAGAISVGAMRFNGGPGLEPEPEPYSSRGPVRHDFGPVDEQTKTPAPPISPEPELLSKPDLLATDCGRTSFFAFFGRFSKFETSAWHFCGTSAAAPHAAAVAALMLEAEPAASPAQIREALVASAEPVNTLGDFDPCSVGAGLIEAVGAVAEIETHSGAAGPVCEPPESEVDPEEAAAPGNWGSEVPPPPSGGSGSTPQVSEPPTETVPQTPRVVAPRTFFRLRPHKVVHTPGHSARVVFSFGSNVSGVTFVCRIDGGLFRPCQAHFVRSFPVGIHVVAVSARDSSGHGDRTPARYRFRVKQVR